VVDDLTIVVMAHSPMASSLSLFAFSGDPIEDQ
jgi:hypothetical protein